MAGLSSCTATVLCNTGSRCLGSGFLQLGGDLVEVDDEDGDVVQGAALIRLPGQHLARGEYSQSD